ncbi:hypothetical protein CANCADRAFT_3552 [Tortispora caseinolytica NRRL Y-17796]|uniref:Uncharacterized protein n=1 Tax=Tortispora caseinolytica NRRL Y-17796 TaxID=767744 RepID=A0A1E4TAY2_9ASCO|nr:hypothetical protein CANCADRAFT_3552 [Tortispora caseinolytica NRRL Y-17796]
MESANRAPKRDIKTRMARYNTLRNATSITNNLATSSQRNTVSRLIDHNIQRTYVPSHNLATAKQLHSTPLETNRPPKLNLDADSPRRILKEISLLSRPTDDPGATSSTTATSIGPETPMRSAPYSPSSVLKINSNTKFFSTDSQQISSQMSPPGEGLTPLLSSHNTHPDHSFAELSDLIHTIETRLDDVIRSVTKIEADMKTTADIARTALNQSRSVPQFNSHSPHKPARSTIISFTTLLGVIIAALTAWFSLLAMFPRIRSQYRYE